MTLDGFDKTDWQEGQSLREREANEESKLRDRDLA
jgi:hypothetical protein